MKAVLSSFRKSNTLSIKEKNMSEFDRIESAVRIVVGRPLSYLTFGILVTCRWLFRSARQIATKLLNHGKPANHPAGR